MVVGLMTKVVMLGGGAVMARGRADMSARINALESIFEVVFGLDILGDLCWCLVVCLDFIFVMKTGIRCPFMRTYNGGVRCSRTKSLFRSGTGRITDIRYIPRYLLGPSSLQALVSCLDYIVGSSL